MLAEDHNNLGSNLAMRGKLTDAIAAFEQAIALKADYPAAQRNLTKALQLAGRMDDAIGVCRRFLASGANDAKTWGLLGDLLLEAGRQHEAGEAFARAAALEPTNPAWHANLGVARRQLGDLDGAITAFRRAAEVSNQEPIYRNLAAVLGDVGNIPEALLWLRRRLEFRPAPASAVSDYLYALLHDESVTPAEHGRQAKAWGEALAASIKRAVHPFASAPQPTSGHRLRLGYISADFREHPTARFIEPILLSHDRSRFEVFCYSDVAKADEVTARCRSAAEVWRETRGLSDEKLAELIASDGIDILIDSTGHMANNRLAVFARKPAAVQVALPMYPGTTGLNAIDYYFTDALVDPPGTAEALYAEKLVRLEPLGRCYKPDEKSPALIPLPSEKSGAITFGAFNRLGKVTDAMLDAWSAIVLAVPGAKLNVLVEGPGGEQTSPMIRGRFESHGLGPEKVIFAGRRPRWQYLDMLSACDICLDTFPYNGCTTTCDSLWMGTPVVTLSGGTHVSRVGLGLLSQVGLADLATDSVGRYVETAIALANDRERLLEIRSNLRERMRHSPLTDGRRLTAHFEAALRDIWTKAGARQSP